MTVNAIAPYQQFTSSNNQVTQDFNFTIVYPTDINVYFTPYQTTPSDSGNILAYGTDYTVSVNGSSGGTITFITPLPINGTITVLGNQSLARNSDFNSNFPYTPDNINSQFDAIVINEKQVLTDATFSPAYQVTDELTSGDLELPLLANGQTWAMQGGALVAQNLPGDDPGAAALRAELAASNGDTIVGDTLYGTVAQGLAAYDNSGPHYAADTSVTPNLITVTVTPVPTAYNNGELLLIKVANNNTGAVTINKNSLGVHNVFDATGAALTTGALEQDTVYPLTYDSTIPGYRILTVFPQGSTPWSPMYISNLLVTPGTLPQSQYSVSAGFARDMTNTVNCTLAAPLTNGGDVGIITSSGGSVPASIFPLTAGQTIYLYVAWKADGVTANTYVDIVNDASNILADPTVAAAGYIYARRIAWGYMTGTGQMIPINQTGIYTNMVDEFDLRSVTQTNSTTPALVTLPMPAVSTMALVYNFSNYTGGASPPQFIASYSGLALASPVDLYNFNTGIAGAGFASPIAYMPIQTNSSGQINFVASIASSNSNITVSGWIDDRSV